MDTIISKLQLLLSIQILGLWRGGGNGSIYFILEKKINTSLQNNIHNENNVITRIPTSKGVKWWECQMDIEFRYFE